MHNKKQGMDLPVVILCGGRGMRLGLASSEVPKPLLTVGDKPILWHVMNIYGCQGHKCFILCLGYKGSQIRDYFKNNNSENWQITCVDTGLDTPKSKRIAKIKPLIKDENFFLSYGDDLADINLDKLLRFHLQAGAIVTITAVKMFSIFGVVDVSNTGRVTGFREKPYLEKWMNGGFMVMSRKIFDYLDCGELEDDVFEKLVKKRGISAYRHFGSWKTMNTLKDNLELNALWKEGRDFWKMRQGKI